jgi:hypothetical protein
VNLQLIQNGTSSYHPKRIPKKDRPWPSPRQRHQQSGREDHKNKDRNFCNRNPEKNHENCDGDKRED